MALSNSQYDAIIREYGRQQLQNKHEQDKRVEEIYRRIPAVKELDDAISTTAVEAAKKVPLLPEGADAPALCPVQY